jgi:hypothetical protein
MIYGALHCYYARSSLLFQNMEEKHLSEGFIEVLDLSFAKVLDLKGF